MPKPHTDTRVRSNEIQLQASARVRAYMHLKSTTVLRDSKARFETQSTH